MSTDQPNPEIGFDAVPEQHNPDRLMPEQVGASEGWRLLGKDERSKDGKPIPETQWWDSEEREWSSTGIWSSNDVSDDPSTLRTQLSRAALLAARGLPPISEPSSSPVAATEEATPLSDGASFLATETSACGVSRSVFVVTKRLAKDLEMALSASRREVEALKAERDEAIESKALAERTWELSTFCKQAEQEAKILGAENDKLRTELSAKTAEASDLAGLRDALLMEREESREVRDCISAERDDLAAKLQRVEAERDDANRMTEAKSSLLLNIADTLRVRGFTAESHRHIDERVIALAQAFYAAAARALAAEAERDRVRADNETYRAERIETIARALAAEAQAEVMRETLESVPALDLPHGFDCTSLICTCWQGKRADALASTSGQPLLDRLKRAEEDTTRLDWLEANKERIFCLAWDDKEAWKINENPKDSFGGADILAEAPTVRAAIDQACKNPVANTPTA